MLWYFATVIIWLVNVCFTSELIIYDTEALSSEFKSNLRYKKKIEMIAKNPFPKSLGGLGEPLRGELKNLLKFRFNNHYRVVYQLKIEQTRINILIVGLRADGQVYQAATNRL